MRSPSLAPVAPGAPLIPDRHAGPGWAAAVSAGLLLALLTGCFAALNWREVRPEGSAARLLFPCRPKSQSRLVLLAGSQQRLTLLSCEADGLTFGLALTDLVDPGQTGAVMQALADSAVANLQGRELSRSRWSPPGATPHAATARMRLQGQRPSGGALESELGLAVNGLQVVQVTVLGPRVEPAQAEAFIASLRWDSP
jgi:hypothetical protein